MAAIVSVPHVFSPDSLPTRLGTSENLNGSVSLWDILRLHAHNFVAAFNTLGQAEMELRSRRTLPSDRTFGAVGATLGMLQKHCENLGLEFSARLLKRRTEEPSSLRTLDGVLRVIEEVKERIWDDLDMRVYVQIEQSTANYYEPTEPPFGRKVFDCFPSAIVDIIEASNCIALERNTASVFHLMRVMESALRALSRELGIPYAPSWESYLRQLNTVIEGDWKAKPADMRRKQPVYKELIGDLQSIKTAWRNPTMHIVRTYDRPESLSVFECVRQLMVRMASAGIAD